jgi:hypothetical protein
MERTFAGPQIDIAHLLVAALWFGLLVGVSFIATPAKFGATTLGLPVALDVGRATFGLFNGIEWGMLALLATVVIFSGPFAFASFATVLLAVILTAQTTWLLPILNDRIAEIIGGHTPVPAPYHIIYIAADLAKGGLLAAMVWAQAKRLAAQMPKISLPGGAAERTWR